MKEKMTHTYIAAYLALLIPTPGRFVYGLTIMIELLLLSGVGVLMESLIKKLKLENLKTVILMTTMISVAVLYRQLFIIWQTELALTLGYIFYLPAVSLFIIGFLFSNDEMNLLQRAKYTFSSVAIFCATGLVLFLFRDIAGYGTFTFYGANHMIFEKVLFNPDNIGVFTFFASIPGTLFLCGISLFIHNLINSRLSIFEKGEAHK